MMLRPWRPLMNSRALALTLFLLLTVLQGCADARVPRAAAVPAAGGAHLPLGHAPSRGDAGTRAPLSPFPLSLSTGNPVATGWAD
jgi:hypothetical protein